jgi:hypothetical protein
MKRERGRRQQRSAFNVENAKGKGRRTAKNLQFSYEVKLMGGGSRERYN